MSQIGDCLQSWCCLIQVVANINNLHVLSIPLTDQFQLPVEKVSIFYSYFGSFIH